MQAHYDDACCPPLNLHLRILVHSVRAFIPARRTRLARMRVPIPVSPARRRPHVCTSVEALRVYLVCAIIALCN
ncbi:MAG: hypothetical protein C0183_00115 [Roseiflexus castenholzii]|nr:MAG: hypothetical protein C0183_00115 [Roseiflexus castenholzii]